MKPIDLTERKTNSRSKAVSSVVAYILMFTLALSFTFSAYMLVMPIISDTKSKSEFEYMMIYMTKLDDKIKNVAHGGEGSKDYITFNIQDGVFNVFANTDRVEYLLASNACLEVSTAPNLYLEKGRIDSVCVNKIILNYTTIDIITNITRRGFVQLAVENLGFQDNRPILKIE